MLITLAFGIVFIGSCFMFWYCISGKIPHVVAIHDDVITQRLHEDSARFRLFLLHAKTFYKEEYYHAVFWNFLGKIFYKLHIFVLKIDNSLMMLLKKIRMRGGPSPALSGLAGLAASEQDMYEQVAAEKVALEDKSEVNYWSVLKKEDTRASIRVHIHTPRRHVEKVRMRVSKTPAVRKVRVKPETSQGQDWA